MRVGVRSVRTVLRAHNSLMVYTPILNVRLIVNEALLESAVALDIYYATYPTKTTIILMTVA